VADASPAAITLVGSPPSQKGFAAQPRRWVVERSIAWIGRRLAYDHEATTSPLSPSSPSPPLCSSSGDWRGRFEAGFALLKPSGQMERWDGIWGLGARPSMRGMTKSAVKVTREALVVGQRSFLAYGSRTFRHDFTQAQLFALLVLRQFLRIDYRGLVTLVAEWQDLRKTLRLRKVPHYSSLAYAARRLLPEAEKGGPSTIPKSLSWSGPGPLV
jgi:hypothetical protein